MADDGEASKPVDGENAANAGGENAANAGGENAANGGGENAANGGGENAADAGGENAANAGGETDPPPGDVPVVSLSIWPPSQRSRDAVIERLIKTLSTPSLANRRYGLFPVDEAAALSRRIEEEAFDVAQSNGVPATDDEGIEFLHLYSKDISKRMMEAITSRPSLASSTLTSEDDAGIAESTPADSVSAMTHADEDDSSVQQETA